MLVKGNLVGLYELDIKVLEILKKYNIIINEIIIDKKVIEKLNKV